jgi:hypothetical protein
MVESLFQKRIKRGIVYKTSAVSTVCHCPKCDTDHNKFIHWTGRGIPRIYCRICENHEEVTGGDVIYKNPNLKKAIY